MKIVKDEDDPNTVIVLDNENDPVEFGEQYSVVQQGFWFWKKFFIGLFVGDTAAGGINDGGHWWQRSDYFETEEEAQQALYKGEFEAI